MAGNVQVRWIEQSVAAADRLEFNQTREWRREFTAAHLSFEQSLDARERVAKQKLRRMDEATWSRWERRASKLYLDLRSRLFRFNALAAKLRREGLGQKEMAELAWLRVHIFESQAEFFVF
jgi:hypothetical protein